MTQASELNQPWYGLVMKCDQTSAAVLLVKLQRYILFLDPAAMAHGRVHIRNYESFATKYLTEEASCQAFDQYLGSTSRKPNTAPIFHNSGTKLIYPPDLSRVISEFPRDEGSLFAQIAMQRATDYVNKQSPSLREQELCQEIKRLKGKRRSSKKKRTDTPSY